MLRCLAIFGTALLLATSSSRSQDGPEKESRFIDSQFQAAIGEIPQLAWLLPDHTVDAQSRAPDIFLYSSARTVERAELRAVLSQVEIELEPQRHHVACDLILEQKPPVLSVYTSTEKLAARGRQLLFTTKQIPEVQGGFAQCPLSGKAATEVWKRMNPVTPGQMRRSKMIRRDGVPYSYSFVALYSGSENYVMRIGIFLHAADGKILAAHTERAATCADCEPFKFADGIDAIFRVENMFTAPAFPYPLLMLDTSTIEGRAISLKTFTSSGEFSQHRYYEYVVNCFN